MVIVVDFVRDIILCIFDIPCLWKYLRRSLVVEAKNQSNKNCHHQSCFWVKMFFKKGLIKKTFYFCNHWRCWEFWSYLKKKVNVISIATNLIKNYFKFLSNLLTMTNDGFSYCFINDHLSVLHWETKWYRSIVILCLLWKKEMSEFNGVIRWTVYSV